MTDPDVLKDLDEWLWDVGDRPDRTLLQRARYEIVALRDILENERNIWTRVNASARAEALEEAARLCKSDALKGSLVADAHANTVWDLAVDCCAAAIRALASPPEPSA